MALREKLGLNPLAMHLQISPGKIVFETPFDDAVKKGDKTTIIKDLSVADFKSFKHQQSEGNIFTARLCYGSKDAFGFL
jgi:hypothetical protein